MPSAFPMQMLLPSAPPTSTMMKPQPAPASSPDDSASESFSKVLRKKVERPEDPKPKDSTAPSKKSKPAPRGKDRKTSLKVAKRNGHQKMEPKPEVDVADAEHPADEGDPVATDVATSEELTAEAEADAPDAATAKKDEGKDSTTALSADAIAAAITKAAARNGTDAEAVEGSDEAANAKSDASKLTAVANREVGVKSANDSADGTTAQAETASADSTDAELASVHAEATVGEANHSAETDSHPSDATEEQHGEKTSSLPAAQGLKMEKGLVSNRRGHVGGDDGDKNQNTADNDASRSGLPIDLSQFELIDSLDAQNPASISSDDDSGAAKSAKSVGALGISPTQSPDAALAAGSDGTNVRDVSRVAGPDAPQAPIAPEQFAEANHPKIVSDIRGELLPHGGTMQIRLDPPELGVLQVKVEMRDGVMTASFETSNDDATKLLTHSLGQLKAVLESQGVSVEKLHVERAPHDREASNQNDSRQNQHAEADGQSARQEQQRREMLRRMWRRISGTGDPLDLVA